MYESEENVLLKLKDSMRGREKQREKLSESVTISASEKHVATILVHSPELHIKRTTDHKEHSYDNNRQKIFLSFHLFMLACIFYLITEKLLNKLFKNFLNEHLNSAS